MPRGTSVACVTLETYTPTPHDVSESSILPLVVPLTPSSHVEPPEQLQQM